MVKSSFKIKYDNLSRLIHKDQVRLLEALKKNKQLNLTQLRKKLNIRRMELYRHSNKLIKAGLVKRTKKKRTQGSPVFLSLKK